MTKNEIIEYLMTTPNNTNRSVLNSILGDKSNKEAIIAYAMQTPHNMNRMVLESLIEDDVIVAMVGTAVVGTAVVG